MKEYVTAVWVWWCVHRGARTLDKVAPGWAEYAHLQAHHIVGPEGNVVTTLLSHGIVFHPESKPSPRWFKVWPVKQERPLFRMLHRQEAYGLGIPTRLRHWWGREVDDVRLLMECLWETEVEKRHES